MVDVRVARGDELDPGQLYALLRLRVAVFVVEQECPYQELDGRDLDGRTRHLWLAPAGTPMTGADRPGGAAQCGTPLAYLRVLAEPDGSARIGRVCVDPAARGAGHARTLLRAALDLTGGRPRVLDAQSYLVGFYREFGFAVAGPEFVEDGIPHVPMALPLAP